MSMPKAYEGKEPYIFVSYAHKDSDKVIPIIQALAARGMRVWYDAGIEAGTEWPEYIAEHLDGCACFLAFLSQSSLDSHNCRREINFAIELRKDPLVVHLEDVKMTLGMRMQLGSLQAMFYHRHNSLDSFVEALTASEILRPCQAVSSASVPEVRAADNAEAAYLTGKQFDDNKNYSEAFSWYHKAAQMGHAEAQARLGKLYYDGNGTAKSYEEAVKWFAKSAAQGSALGQHYLAWCNCYGHGVSKNTHESARLWKLSAAQGLAQAQNCLGVSYREGIGLPVDYSAAANWFRQAAEQGYPKAQCSLGSCYSNGRGVSRNHTEAVKWFRLAADQGNAIAQRNLANCYYNGYGVAKDLQEAAKWFQKAAEQGHEFCQYQLATMYSLGEGVAEDYAEAAKWYQKAAEQGNVRSQVSLGMLYLHGSGVAKNYDEAIKWFRMAAQTEDAFAHYYMGHCFENGYGVSKDLHVALKWYKKSDALTESQEGIARIEKALAQPAKRDYVIIDPVTGKPMDDSAYTFKVDPSILPKTCQMCGSRMLREWQNTCRVCGYKNDD